MSYRRKSRQVSGAGPHVRGPCRRRGPLTRRIRSPPAIRCFRNPAPTGTFEPPGPLTRRIRSPPATRCSATPRQPAPFEPPEPRTRRIRSPPATRSSATTTPTGAFRAARTAHAEDPVAPGDPKFRNTTPTGAFEPPEPRTRRIRSPPATRRSATPHQPAPLSRPNRARGGSGRPRRPDVPQHHANRRL